MTFKTLQEKGGRLCGFILFTGMLLRQFYYLPDFSDSLNTVRWSLVTLLFLLFWLAYIKRKPAKSLASNPLEVLLPTLCAGLPFAIILGYFYIHKYQEFIPDPILSWLLYTTETPLYSFRFRIQGMSIMAIGEIITVAGMFYLGSSFSIFTEARVLIRDGIYKFIRHPLYSGEIISVWGYALAYPSYYNLSGAFLFTFLQSLRAKLEERKLKSVFPEYSDYQKQCGFLLPKIWKTKT